MIENNQSFVEIQKLQKQMDFYTHAITQIKGQLELLEHSMSALLHSQECFDPVGPLKLPLLEGVHGEIDYYRLLNTVFIQGTLEHLLANGYPNQFAQLPEGYKPKHSQKRSAIGSRGNTSVFLEISDSGRLSYTCPPSLSNPSDEVFTIDITFHV